MVEAADAEEVAAEAATGDEVLAAAGTEPVTVPIFCCKPET